MQKLIGTAPDRFSHALASISFNTEANIEKTKQTQNLISSEKSQLENLNLEQQRFLILDDAQELVHNRKVVAEEQDKLQTLYHQLLASQFILFSASLQTKASNVFKQKEVLLQTADHLANSEAIKAQVVVLLDTLVQQLKGVTASIKGSSIEEIKTAINLFWERLNKPFFSLNHTSITLLKLFLALALTVSGFFSGAAYKRSLKRQSGFNQKLNTSTRILLANPGNDFIVTIAIMIALNTLGIDQPSLALDARALSVGVGLGIQNIIFNFVSGIILMLERSIKIGDYLEFDGSLSGHETDIRMRSVTINTNANINAITPNQELS